MCSTAVLQLLQLLSIDMVNVLTLGIGFLLLKYSDFIPSVIPSFYPHINDVSCQKCKNVAPKNNNEHFEKEAKNGPSKFYF